MFPVTSISIFVILTWICPCLKSKSYELILRGYKRGMKVGRNLKKKKKRKQQNCNLYCFDIRVPLPTCHRDNRHEQALIVQIKLKHRTGLGPVASPHVISTALSTLQGPFITLMCYKEKGIYRNKRTKYLPYNYL